MHMYFRNDLGLCLMEKGALNIFQAKTKNKCPKLILLLHTELKEMTIFTQGGNSIVKLDIYFKVFLVCPFQNFK